MNIISNHEAFSILTLLYSEYLDWGEREEYSKVLVKYGYNQEAKEICEINEADFYDYLHAYLYDFKPTMN